ncbi:annexin D8 [Cajanus cajan]|uniref:Annexin-like protein RJ4 n=1 Tax=Cajanus cajan TaxID=3821 RepID=A0A151SB67_CAJCA|nr:annexin D8 [Cajanus cajan]KYP52054.1 Annexin-like protein RJ4 [Cajanus cajan]
MATLIAAKDSSPIEDAENIKKACKGLGTDETTLISILAHRDVAQRKLVRLAYEEIYHEDLIQQLKSELSGSFQRAICDWTMDPAERDAAFINEVLKKETPDYKVIIEIACTRTSEEFLAVKRSYHFLYKHCLEEDLASKTIGDIRRLLVAVVSTYRYDGDEFDENLAHLEANVLHELIEQKTFNDDEIFRILCTRSKKQLCATFSTFRNIYGTTITKGLSISPIDEYMVALRTTFRCIKNPRRYLTKVLSHALSNLIAEDHALSRVIITRAEKDLNEIDDIYFKRNGVTLGNSVAKKTSGNYKTFLLALLGKNCV